MVKRQFLAVFLYLFAQGQHKVVRRPQNAPRQDPQLTVKTVKLSDSVMVCDAFSGTHGRGGLYFLPRNVTMKGFNYLEMLNNNLLPFWRIHQPTHFMLNGVPVHKTKLVTKWLKKEIYLF